MTVCQARHPEEAAPVYSLLGLRAGEGASAADRGNHTVFYGDIHTGANGHIRRQDACILNQYIIDGFFHIIISIILLS